MAYTFSLWIVSSLLCLLLWAGHAHARPDAVTIVFAADMPLIDDPNHGDYAELASLLRHQRSQSDVVFFLHGGGNIGPSPMSAFDRGAHIIDIMNHLEPDMMAATKREFSYFEDELSLRCYEAGFPIVASNLFDTLTESNVDGLVDQVIIEKSGIRMGVISVLDDSLVQDYLTTRILVNEPDLAIQQKSERLRQQGVDLVVLMYSRPFDFIDTFLNNGVLDLALMSDPHFSLTEHQALPQHPNSVALIKPGQAITLNVLWTLDIRSTASVTWQVTNLSELAPEPSIYALVQQYSNRLNRLLGEQIARLETSMTTSRLAVRGNESAFGNLITDAMREFAKTEIGFINGGLIRGEAEYSPGSVLTRRDIITEMPFRARLVVLELTGEQLLQSLENSVSQLEELKGRFMQVSGMRIRYNSALPVGQRIQSVEVNGQPLQKQRKYSVATTDYLARGGDGYTEFAKARKVSDVAATSPLVSDILIYKLRRADSVRVTVEGRIQDTKGRS